MSEVQMRVSSRDVQLQLFRLKDIPPASGILQDVMRVIGDDQAELREVAAVIERSPEMTARLLRCANSSYYGQRRRIVTVEDAIIRVLGLSITRGLVLAMAVTEGFNARACPSFRAEQHWFMSLATAELAQRLALHLADDFDSPPSVAYSAGLLHNLGLLALVHTFPRQMDRIFSSPGDGGLHERLRAEFGFDQDQAGALLARNWGLPELLALVVEHQAVPGYRQTGWQLARLVGVAKTIGSALFRGEAPRVCTSELAGLPLSEGLLAATIDKMSADLEGLLDLAYELSGKER